MEPKNIFDFFFSMENPAIYGLLLVLLILVILFLIKKEFISPLTKKKLELENENIKLMALFAEIDPDPILRVDKFGIIISANNTALNDFKGINLIGSEFSNIITDFDIEEIESSEEKVVKLNDRFFNISVREGESLDFRQVYLHDITKRIQYEKQIEEYQTHLKNLRTRLETYNENEKQRLGKELHDSIGQNISLLKIKVQKFLETDKEAKNKDDFISLLTQIDELSTDVREISYQLRPRILNEFGLIPALSSLIDSVNSNIEMKGLISSNNEDIKFSNELDLNIFRICQEAITNIVKHSSCKNFFIQILHSENELRIIISDDGKGFAVNDYIGNGTPSLGLLNMRERVSNFNGELNIESVENEGTTLFITFNNINDWKEYDSNFDSR